MSKELQQPDLIIELRYRKIVFKFFYLLVFACVVSLAFIVRINILKLAELDWYVVAFRLIVASSVPLTILIRATVFFAPRLFSTYKVDSSKLLITSRRKSREAFFEQIHRLNFSKLSPRFFGGFNIRLKSGVRFRFPTLMEKGDQLLHHIMKARPDLKSEEEYLNYLHTLKLVEVSWQRIRDKASQWKHLLFKFVLYPGAVAFLFHYRGLLASIEANAIYNYLIWFFFITFCMSALALWLNHFEEKLNNRHLRKLQDDATSENRLPGSRDKHYESRLQMISNGLYYFITGSTIAALLFYF